MNNPSQPPQPAQPDMALLLLGSFFEDLHAPVRDDAIAEHIEVVIVPLAGRTGDRGALEGQIVLVHFTEPTCAAYLETRSENPLESVMPPFHPSW